MEELKQLIARRKELERQILKGRIYTAKTTRFASNLEAAVPNSL
jgi:hypothetical protein